MPRPINNTPVVPGVTEAVPVAQAEAAEALQTATALYDAATLALAEARRAERQALQTQARALEGVLEAQRALQVAAVRR
ncbi:MAG TPA: hypothetical protein VEY30_02555 [Myxococcaceae bacterium]|nr:hypothetical protein [Myxococcaceae bacterium]